MSLRDPLRILGAFRVTTHYTDAELAKALDLKPDAVTYYLSDLIEDDLLTFDGEFYTITERGTDVMQLAIRNGTIA